MALSEPTSPYTGPSDPGETGRIWNRLSKWLGRDDAGGNGVGLNPSHDKSDPLRPSLGRRLSRRVVPGLPRPLTFKRQNSEKRDRLLTVDQSMNDRRAQSLDRRRARSLIPLSSTAYSLARFPIPQALQHDDSEHEQIPSSNIPAMDLNRPQMRPMPPSTPPADADHEFNHQIRPAPGLPAPQEFLDQINQELEEKWILNLSMHFRDNSPREKFFVTFAEIPTRWRRVTVSCDYRDAPPDSLERDLQSLSYQREKNARIYDAIRNSLPDIQFYDTVTNLRLQTDLDDRLHVHVTEDVNEIIPYPSIAAVKHLDYLSVSEHDIEFDSHMSGFVYKVRVNNEAFEGKVCVKKEIPGPDSVEEFLYEINVLHALIGTSNVIQFEGLVIDEENDAVKGLLISYANQGPLVDLIYDFKATGALSWERKAKWAQQMIYGVSAIHEAGFVQGDCTLSNVVIDQYDDALIIDVNRRGCPVGWEPPEIHDMVDNGHRISMYIGIKSDLFQLGMSLWALITEEDEPERQSRPLTFSSYLEVPEDKKYLIEVAKICLSERPRDRLSAEKLLSFFPQEKSPYTDMIRTEVSGRDRIVELPSERDTVYVDPSSGVVADIAGGRFDKRQYISRSDHGRRSLSTDREEDRRGRTPPNGISRAHRNSIGHGHDGNDHVEPVVLSVSPGREPRLSTHFYGLDTDEDDEEAIQRVLRRRQRMRSIGGTSQKRSSQDDYDDVLRSLNHTDSGLGRSMHIDTSAHDIRQYPRGLDHVDSGLADMDINNLTIRDLTPRHLDLQEFGSSGKELLLDSEGRERMSPTSREPVSTSDKHIEKPGSNTINSELDLHEPNIDRPANQVSTPTTTA